MASISRGGLLLTRNIYNRPVNIKCFSTGPVMCILAAKSPFSLRHQLNLFSSCGLARTSIVPNSFQQKGYNTIDKKFTSSFAAALFCGKINVQQCFPYPESLGKEDLENLPIIIDSIDKYFQQNLDTLAFDLKKEMPTEFLEGIKELGLFGIQIPSQLGGIGLNNTCYARLCEAMSKYDLGTGITLGAHQSIGLKGILLFGNEKQKQKYLPHLASGKYVSAFALTEASSGSDAQSITTRAIRNLDGSWTLNGSKIWITNGGIAQIFTVFAKTEVKDPQTGVMKDKMMAFIVERAFGGVTSGPPEDKMGIRCSNTTTVTFEGCRVPNENVLGEVGQGFKIAVSILNNGRFGMSAALTGTSKMLLSRARDHAIERKQFGMFIKDFELIQKKISDMTLYTYALESTAYLVSSIMDTKNCDFHLEAACSKVFSSEIATFLADECLQIMGGMGFMRETGIEKIVRDLRIFRIFEGTNEILRLLIGLNGVQHAGDSLKELKEKMKNPLTNFGTLLGAAFKRIPGVSRLQTPPAIIPCHPDVASSARLIEKNAFKLGDMVERLLLKYNKEIVNEQILISRLADIAISIFTMTAVTSRASRALEKNLHYAKHETMLCNTYCQYADMEVQTLFDRFNDKNRDQSVKQISSSVFSAGFQASSPVGL